MSPEPPPRLHRCRRVCRRYRRRLPPRVQGCFVRKESGLSPAFRPTTAAAQSSSAAVVNEGGGDGVMRV
ncbi:hypothetical protein HanXRQr2_Chr16g0737581 [Helianthus annuus]|uniref:Uncharacterized protein n=1 Tax=Helianthus annuus TaxID=4232 RepID=A0A9K3DPT3_HELAN|nr:hypothetical protein HanXRQr2_Chr16g0737581 [Helianthus annuus]